MINKRIKEENFPLRKNVKKDYFDHSSFMFILIIQKFDKISKIIELFEFGFDYLTKRYGGFLHLGISKKREK
jgi:hypothetical protein